MEVSDNINLIKKKKKYGEFALKNKIKRKIFLQRLFIIIAFFISLMILFIIITKNKSVNNIINKIINSNKKSKTKVALCTIAKKENRYIKYFIEFYKKLGFNHIYFYDNNETGDESIDDLQIVKDGIKEGYITVINYKDKKLCLVTETYYDCYERYNLEYDWISFLDVDEFLILEPKGSSIQEFLENPRLNDCDNVKFNWRVFNDNDQLDFEDRPLMERFPFETTFQIENRHVKSTVRGGLNYKNYTKNNSPHSLWIDIKACSSSGNKTDGNYFLWPPDFQYASLNHYVTKSVREFFTKKYKTGVNVDTISQATKDYLFNYFFKVNKKTKEKVDIFNQIYHTNYQ